jgi:hypothetical protein
VLTTRSDCINDGPVCVFAVDLGGRGGGGGCQRRRKVMGNAVVQSGKKNRELEFFSCVSGAGEWWGASSACAVEKNMCLHASFIPL